MRTDDEEHLGRAAAVAAVEEADALPLVAVGVPAHLAVRHCCSPATLLLLIQQARLVLVTAAARGWFLALTVSRGIRSGNGMGGEARRRCLEGSWKRGNAQRKNEGLGGERRRSCGGKGRLFIAAGVGTGAAARGGKEKKAREGRPDGTGRPEPGTRGRMARADMSGTETRRRVAVG